MKAKYSTEQCCHLSRACDLVVKLRYRDRWAVKELALLTGSSSYCLLNSVYIFPKFHFFFSFNLLEFYFYYSLKAYFTTRKCVLHCFPCFSHRLFTTSGLCAYLHPSSRHYIDRIGQTACHLTRRRGSETAWLCILVLSDEFFFSELFLPTFSGFSGGCFDRLELFGEGRECWWIDSWVVSHISGSHGMFYPDKKKKTLLFLPKIEFQSHNSQFRDILCLTTDCVLMCLMLRFRPPIFPPMSYFV